MSNKPYPPNDVHELLVAIGFYSDGFCSGHCEHAPLRTSNPELNSQIEAWHDKYYTSPDISSSSSSKDFTNDFAGEPAVDWRALALDILYAANSFAPADWILQSGDNLSNYLDHELDWYSTRLKPAKDNLNKTILAFPTITDDSDDPF
jgi:hypothetical protein